MSWGGDKLVWSFANIDWNATAACGQVLMSGVGLYVAWTISRAELAAQRTVAREEARRYADMVIGVCDRAEAAIADAAHVLNDRGTVMAMSVNIVPQVSTAEQAVVLNEIDINRIPSARAALGLVQMRALTSRTDALFDTAYAVHADDDEDTEELEEVIATWRRDAAEALKGVREGFAASH